MGPSTRSTEGVDRAALRGRIVQGGKYLAMRQGLGFVLGLGTVLALTWMIGPREYGLFAAAFGIYGFVQALCVWGVPAYLVRQAEAPSEALYDQATTLLVVMGTVAALGAVLALPALAAWMRLPEFAPVALGLLVVLPLAQMNFVPIARLERTLAYREIATIELAGQVVSTSVSLPLAALGAGALAPVSGLVAYVVFAGVRYRRVAAYRPRWRWHLPDVRLMLAAGFSYSVSSYLWQARSLVGPLVVARFAGPEAMAFLALATRLANALGFMLSVGGRVGFSALSRLRDDAAGMRAAITTGMSIQVIALGLPYLAFAFLGMLLVPMLFGPSWAPVAEIFPFIAVALMANAGFGLHSAALYALGRNWDLARAHLLHVVLFAGTATIAVPALGLLGYGLAELVALPAYLLLHRAVGRACGAPGYWWAIAWYLAFAIPIFLSPVAPWTLALPLVPLLSRGVRRDFRALLAPLLGRGLEKEPAGP